MSALAIREPSFAALGDIVANCQGVKFRYGSNRRAIVVDLFTASAILAVHRAVNADNQAKIERMVAGSPELLAKIAAFAISKIS